MDAPPPLRPSFEVWNEAALAKAVGRRPTSRTRTKPRFNALEIL
jgi:hypothetical protein